MKPCVTGIVLATGLYMTSSIASVKRSSPNRCSRHFVIFGLVLGKWVTNGSRKETSPIGLILASAVLGIIVYGG